MIADLQFYRSQAVEAAEQAGVATSRTVRDRCEGFASWWSALGDAVETGDLPRAAALAGNVVYLDVREGRGESLHLV